MTTARINDASVTEVLLYQLLIPFMVTLISLSVEIYTVSCTEVSTYGTSDGQIIIALIAGKSYALNYDNFNKCEKVNR